MKIQLCHVLKCSSSALLLASLVNSTAWAMEEDANDKNPAYIRFQQDKEYEDALQNDFSTNVRTLFADLSQLEHHPCFKILTELSEVERELNLAKEQAEKTPDNPALQRKITKAQETLSSLEKKAQALNQGQTSFSLFQTQWIALRNGIKEKNEQISKKRQKDPTKWGFLEEKVTQLQNNFQKVEPVYNTLNEHGNLVSMCYDASKDERLEVAKIISGFLLSGPQVSAEQLVEGLDQYVEVAHADKGFFPHAYTLLEKWRETNKELLEFIGYEDGVFNAKLFSPDTLQNGFLTHPKKLQAFLAKFKEAPEGLTPLDFNRFIAQCLRLQGLNKEGAAQNLFEAWVFSQKNLPLIKMAICSGEARRYYPSFTISKDDSFFKHFLTHPAHLKEFLKSYDVEEMYDESSDKYKTSTNRRQISFYLYRELESKIENFLQQTSDKALRLSADSSWPLLVPRVLVKCTTLKDLRLKCTSHADRGFEIFPTLELRTLPHLTKLSITGAKLSEIPAVLFTLGSLTTLILDENGISEIPSAIASFKNLTKLLMNKNSLHTVAPEIGHLSFLEVLELSSQGPWVWHAGHAQDKQTSPSLSHLPKEIGNLVNLKVLNLESNILAELPDLGNLTQLESLYVHHNKIARLEDSFCSLPLTTLDFSHNQLTEISGWVPYTVTELNLSHNKISNITSDIGKRTQLKILNLANNKLQNKENIDPALFTLPSLTALDLTTSRHWSEILDELPEDIGKLTTLQSLKVTANKIPKAIVGLLFKNLSDFWQSSKEMHPQLIVLLNIREPLKLHTPKLLRAYFKLMRVGGLERDFGVNLDDDESKPSEKAEKRNNT